MLHKLFTDLRSIILASSAREPTLFEELWEYITQKYLTPEYGVYNNINVDTDSLVQPYMIFIAGFIAVMLGASFVIFNRRTLGRLVRRILKHEANCPDKAMTLEELELSDSKAIKLFINRTTLSKAVRCREEDKYYGIEYVPLTPVDYSGKEDGEKPTEEEISGDKSKDVYAISINTPSKLRYKRDPEKDHFYIPEHKCHHARVRFDSKGTNPMTLLILAAVYIVGGLILIQILPHLLTFFDNAITAFKGGI